MSSRPGGEMCDCYFYSSFDPSLRGLAELLPNHTRIMLVNLNWAPIEVQQRMWHNDLPEEALCLPDQIVCVMLGPLICLCPETWFVSTSPELIFSSWWSTFLLLISFVSLGPVYKEMKPGVALKIVNKISASTTRSQCFGQWSGLNLVPNWRKLTIQKLSCLCYYEWMTSPPHS